SNTEYYILIHFILHRIITINIECACKMYTKHKLIAILNVCMLMYIPVMLKSDSCQISSYQTPAPH
ncbi:hypothetical protein SC162_15500, partial [Legionella pneumophila serogroup 1]